MLLVNKPFYYLTDPLTWIRQVHNKVLQRKKNFYPYNECCKFPFNSLHFDCFLIWTQDNESYQIVVDWGVGPFQLDDGLGEKFDSAFEVAWYSRFEVARLRPSLTSELEAAQASRQSASAGSETGMYREKSASSSAESESGKLWLKKWIRQFDLQSPITEFKFDVFSVNLNIKFGLSENKFLKSK